MKRQLTKFKTVGGYQNILQEYTTLTAQGEVPRACLGDCGMVTKHHSALLHHEMTHAMTYHSMNTVLSGEYLHIFGPLPKTHSRDTQGTMVSDYG